MSVEEITWGGTQQGYVVRYRGNILGGADSASEAYDQLAQALRPHSITPLFRVEDGRHTVILMEGVVDPQPSNPRTNILLFIATLISMMLVGAFYTDSIDLTGSGSEIFRNILVGLGRGWPFAVSLLAILLAHEFGHYLAARYHKTAVTLPYFLPLPLPGSFGTLGAFIQLKEPPKNKRVLLDIGIAGPLAGLIVAIPVLLLGIYLSPVERLPLFIPEGRMIVMEGNSILYLLSKYIIHGQMLPAPTSYMGMPPLLFWIRYIFTGLPSPMGSLDVSLHPVAWAGWAGLLVTALNLIPAGQLDGGHVLYVLFGKRAKAVLPFILGGLALLGLIWPGWWLWVLLIFFLGRVHAEPLDQITPLDPRRKLIAILGIIVFILVFVPVPLQQFIGPHI